MVTNKKYRGLFIVKTKKWFQVFGIALMSFMLIYLVGCQDNDNENECENSDDKINEAENCIGNSDSDDDVPLMILYMKLTNKPDTLYNVRTYVEVHTNVSKPVTD